MIEIFNKTFFLWFFFNYSISFYPKVQNTSSAHNSALQIKQITCWHKTASWHICTKGLFLAYTVSALLCLHRVYISADFTSSNNTGREIQSQPRSFKFEWQLKSDRLSLKDSHSSASYRTQTQRKPQLSQLGVTSLPEIPVCL